MATAGQNTEMHRTLGLSSFVVANVLVVQLDQAGQQRDDSVSVARDTGARVLGQPQDLEVERLQVLHLVQAGHGVLAQVELAQLAA